MTFGTSRSDFGRRLARWAAISGEYAAWQTVVQLVAALTGFVVVRTLAKSDYALLAIVYAATALFVTFTDVGIGVALRSIGGKLVGQPGRYSQLMVTLIRLRRALFAGALLVVMPYALWMLASNGATFDLTAVLGGLMLVTTLPLMVSLILRGSELVLGNYRQVQWVELSGGGVRLGLTVALLAIWPSVLAALAATAIANVAQLGLYRRQAGRSIDLHAGPNARDRDAAWSLTKRLAPNSLFFAFQGQLSLFILTLLASSGEVADVAAVGRIALLVNIFAMVFYNVLAPRYARVGTGPQLRRDYAMIVLAAIAMSIAIAAAVYAVPQPFLWLLGPQYSGLATEVAVAVAVAGLTMVAGTILTLNQSHAWVRLYSIYYIPAAIVGMVMVATVVDLSTVTGVLIVSGAVPAATAVVCLGDAIIGLRGAKGSARAWPRRD